MRRYIPILKEAGKSFIADNALSRGAAIAYYTVFALGPVMLLIIAIVGLVYGQDAAEGAIAGELQDLMGQTAADQVQNLVKSVHRPGAGAVASVIGVLTLLISASGVFSELQSALNTIWRAESHHGTVTRLLRARAVSLGLVAALGFLMIVSLIVSAVLHAVGGYIGEFFPGTKTLMWVANITVSVGIITVMFAAIYKVLPDRDIAWRDVLIGAVVTSILFQIGKYLISLYIGTTGVSSSYGAAGALIVVMVWIYYSSQIFLFGAEFTRVYAETHGSYKDHPLARPADLHAVDRLKQELSAVSKP